MLASVMDIYWSMGVGATTYFADENALKVYLDIKLQILDYRYQIIDIRLQILDYRYLIIDIRLQILD